MNATRASRRDHRRHLLRALGVTPYVLRAGPSGHSASSAGPASACVLVLPEGCTPRLRQLLARAVRASSGRFAVTAEVTAARVSNRLPVSGPCVYVTCGAASARAVQRVLPEGAATGIKLIELDEPDTLLVAEGKRRLWQATGRLRGGRDAPVVRE